MANLPLDSAFTLPLVGRRRRLNWMDGGALHSLISGPRQRVAGSHVSDSIRAIWERARELRGDSITWAFDLHFNDIFPYDPHAGEDESPHPQTLALVFFKRYPSGWLPKVIVESTPAYAMDMDQFQALQAVSRRHFVEYLHITQETLETGYLFNKNFKRAFNGAFFSDEPANPTVFCPTLRSWGFVSWEQPAGLRSF